MSFSLRKLEGAPVADKGGGLKHGTYAYLAGGKLPSGRAWKRVQAEISTLRAELIKQYGGDKIQPSVLCLLESAIEGLTIQKLSTLYVKKAGILRRDALKDGDLSLHSVLSGQFISYANLVRLNLEAAARLADRKPMDPGAEDVLTYAARVYPEDKPPAQEDAEKRPESDVEARSSEGMPDDATDESGGST
jgi:hypothetical protein